MFGITVAMISLAAWKECQTDRRRPSPAFLMLAGSISPEIRRSWPLADRWSLSRYFYYILNAGRKIHSFKSVKEQTPKPAGKPGLKWKSHSFFSSTIPFQPEYPSGIAECQRGLFKLIKWMNILHYGDQLSKFRNIAVRGKPEDSKTKRHSIPSVENYWCLPREGVNAGLFHLPSS